MRSLAFLAVVTLVLPATSKGWLFGIVYTDICSELCRCPRDILEASREPLDCRENNITSIPNRTTIPDAVSTIDFTRNRIQSLNLNTFEETSYVTGIDFSDNELEELPDKIFEPLPKLESLIFKNNKLHTIQENAFAGLGNLSKLDLSYNQLTSLPRDVFALLPKLEVLILDFNQISNVDKISLARNTALRSLHLSAMGIYNLHPDFLPMNLTKLTHIRLAYNDMIDIPSKTFFHVKDSLTDLDLSGNPFASLGAYTFYGLNNLKHLRLDQMLKLVSIDAFAFGDLLRLESCVIRYMPKISYLDPLAFYSNRNGSSRPIPIKDFTFAFSVLTTLPEKLLDWNSLQYLNLRYNHWSCDCDMKWVKNSTVLKLVEDNMVCSEPMRLRGHRIITVPKKEMTCSVRTEPRKASIGFLIGVLMAGLGVSLGTIALLVYLRQGWLFRRPYGTYVSIERGPTEITVVDDAVIDK